MATERGGTESLESFMEGLSAVATEHFADGEVDVPVLHFLHDEAIGVLPLFPLPKMEPSNLARLVVGLYDPPMAAVLAEGWATNLALPPEIDEALAGQRPWGEVAERVRKRLAPALPHYPELAAALRAGDVKALHGKHHGALIYAWHDAMMGPVVREGRSLKDLPAHVRRKIMTLFGEDRQGNSKSLLWHIEYRRGRRHFVPESLEGSSSYASSWHPLYMAMEMAAVTRQPLSLVRPRVRELCREQLRPYQVAEGIHFTETGVFFNVPMPPDAPLQ